MAIKKQVILFSVIFDDEETYGESAAAAIEHKLYNEEGIIEWNHVVKSEDSMTTDFTEEELKDEQ